MTTVLRLALAAVFAVAAPRPAPAQEQAAAPAASFGAGAAACSDFLADQPSTADGIVGTVRRLQTEEWILGFASAMNVMSLAHAGRDFLAGSKGEDVVASVVARCREDRGATVQQAVSAYVAAAATPPEAAEQ